MKGINTHVEKVNDLGRKTVLGKFEACLVTWSKNYLEVANKKPTGVAVHLGAVLIVTGQR